MLTPREWEAVYTTNRDPQIVAFAQGLTLEETEAQIDAARQRIEGRRVQLCGTRQLMTPLLTRPDLPAYMYRSLG